jgi:hypothetical protein
VKPNPDRTSGPHRPTRRSFLAAGLSGGVAAAPTAAAAPAPDEGDDFELNEVTIAGLQERLRSGKETARSLAEKYLARIEAIDRRGPTLRSVIEVNPEALAAADALDRERKEKGPRGPLHGVPILLKDNIDTADRMATTAGSLALVGARPPKDAFLVRRLREAGAVLLGKTNLSEWANIRWQLLHQRLERPGRPDQEPLRPGPQPLRLQLRLRRGRRRQPLRRGGRYLFGLRGGGLFAFAGLWEQWGGTLLSCAVLTVPANALVRPLHERMPAILHRDDYSLWLDPAVQDIEALQALLRVANARRADGAGGPSTGLAALAPSPPSSRCARSPTRPPRRRGWRRKAGQPRRRPRARAGGPGGGPAPSRGQGTTTRRPPVARGRQRDVTHG